MPHLPDSEPEPPDFARGVARADLAQDRDQAEAWHEELFEPPLPFPIDSAHALAQAELGQAHHAAHQANAHATAQAFAAHIARYEHQQQQAQSKSGGWSYSRELGDCLARHAQPQVAPFQAP